MMTCIKDWTEPAKLVRCSRTHRKITMNHAHLRMENRRWLSAKKKKKRLFRGSVVYNAATTALGVRCRTKLTFNGNHISAACMILHISSRLCAGNRCTKFIEFCGATGGPPVQISPQLTTCNLWDAIVDDFASETYSQYSPFLSPSCLEELT